MDFSCFDSLSVSRMKRMDENLMIWGCFAYKYPQLEIVLERPFEKTDFDQRSVGGFVNPPVLLCIHVTVIKNLY